MLRDLLCLHPDLTTWPCDEINPIWRYGNRAHPSDELTTQMATPKVQHYIRERFRKLERRSGGKAIVEKTCANTLRVPYVNAVFPEARFIFLIRDGRDAVASAMTRWTGSTSLPYILRKARWAPMRDLPQYGVDFVRNRLAQWGNAEQALRTWGPRFSGIDEWVRTHDLLTVCAEQWKQCILKAAAGLKAIAPERVLDLRYESLVGNPESHVAQMLAFCGLPRSNDVEQRMIAAISPGNVGKHTRQLDATEVTRLQDCLRPLLEEYDYL